MGRVAAGETLAHVVGPVNFTRTVDVIEDGFIIEKAVIRLCAPALYLLGKGGMKGLDGICVGFLNHHKGKTPYH